MTDQGTNTSAPASVEQALDALGQRRALAECRKVELEAAELERKLNRKWYRARFFIETVVGAVVASALVATWIMSYMQPLLNRRQEAALLDAQIQAKLGERQRLENEARTAILEREKNVARNQLVALA